MTRSIKRYPLPTRPSSGLVTLRMPPFPRMLGVSCSETYGFAVAALHALVDDAQDDINHLLLIVEENSTHEWLQHYQSAFTTPRLDYVGHFDRALTTFHVFHCIGLK